MQVAVSRFFSGAGLSPHRLWCRQPGLWRVAGRLPGRGGETLAPLCSATGSPHICRFFSRWPRIRGVRDGEGVEPPLSMAAAPEILAQSIVKIEKYDEMPPILRPCDPGRSGRQGPGVEFIPEAMRGLALVRRGPSWRPQPRSLATAPDGGRAPGAGLLPLQIYTPSGGMPDQVIDQAGMPFLGILHNPYPKRVSRAGCSGHRSSFGGWNGPLGRFCRSSSRRCWRSLSRRKLASPTFSSSCVLRDGLCNITPFLDIPGTLKGLFSFGARFGLSDPRARRSTVTPLVMTQASARLPQSCGG